MAAAGGVVSTGTGADVPGGACWTGAASAAGGSAGSAVVTVGVVATAGVAGAAVAVCDGSDWPATGGDIADIALDTAESDGTVTLAGGTGEVAAEPSVGAGGAGTVVAPGSGVPVLVVVGGTGTETVGTVAGRAVGSRVPSVDVDCGSGVGTGGTVPSASARIGSARATRAVIATTAGRRRAGRDASSDAPWVPNRTCRTSEIYPRTSQ